MFEISRESYEKQIKEINEAHQKELNVDLDNLEKEKMVKLDKMVKKYEGSPEDLAKELREMFGVGNEI